MENPTVIVAYNKLKCICEAVFKKPDFKDAVLHLYNCEAAAGSASVIEEVSMTYWNSKRKILCLIHSIFYLPFSEMDKCFRRPGNH